MNSCLIKICCMLSLAHVALAKPDASVPPPPAPYVAAPRSGDHWEILVEQRKALPSESDAGPQNQNRPTLIRAEKTGDITGVTVTWSDGTTQTGYVQGDQYLVMSPRTGRIAILPAQNHDLFQPIFVSVYQATAWIGKKDYQGAEKFGSEDCYKYHREYSEKYVGTDKVYSPEMNAWIRVRDGMPLCVQLGDLVFRFRFFDDTSSSSPIPQVVKQRLDQMKAEQNALEMLRSANSNTQ